MKKIFWYVIFCMCFLLTSCSPISAESEDKELDTLPAYQPQAVDTPDQVEMGEAAQEDGDDPWEN